MPKEERLYSAVQGAFMMRLTLSSFRTRVSRLGIKGQRKGQRTFYTNEQLEDIYYGTFSKAKKSITAGERKPFKRKSTPKRTE
ncbi:MAG: hypothetical protein ABSG38_00920 [Spirochaetia bacterium]